MARSLVSKLLTPDKTAKKLGVSPSTLASWRCRKTYALNYIKVGSRVYYREEDLQQFIERRIVEVGADAPQNRRGKT